MGIVIEYFHSTDLIRVNETKNHDFLRGATLTRVERINNAPVCRNCDLVNGLWMFFTDETVSWRKNLRAFGIERS